MKKEISAELNYADKDYLDQFLTEAEQSQLTSFVMNKTLVEAVRKILLFSLYYSGTITKDTVHRSHINFALIDSETDMSDEEYGKKIRTRWAAVQLLANAFDDFTKYKLEPVPEMKKNPAR